MYRLALALGKTLGEIERGMSGHELDRWRAYHQVEPITAPHWMEAQICSVTVNANRAKGPPAKLEDFLPKLERRGKRRRMTTEEMEAVFRAAADGINRANARRVPPGP